MEHKVKNKIVCCLVISLMGLAHVANATDYHWDGRDQYGDLLANGVYFYRVFVKMNDTEIEKSATDADKFFKEGIGKMYIIR